MTRQCVVLVGHLVDSLLVLENTKEETGEVPRDTVSRDEQEAQLKEL